MPSGDEVTIELDAYTSGKEIKTELIDQDIAPSRDNQGAPIPYKLISKSTNDTIEDHKTLADMQIAEGDTLFMIPDMVAG